METLSPIVQHVAEYHSRCAIEEDDISNVNLREPIRVAFWLVPKIRV